MSDRRSTAEERQPTRTAAASVSTAGRAREVAEAVAAPPVPPEVVSGAGSGGTGDRRPRTGLAAGRAFGAAARQAARRVPRHAGRRGPRWPTPLPRWRPEPDAWCALEVVGHLIEADERGFAGRLRAILAIPDAGAGAAETTFATWDPPAVARARRDDERDRAALLAEFAARRAGGGRARRPAHPRRPRAAAPTPRSAA